MVAPFAETFKAALGNPNAANPFTSAEAMREPIFYGAESAYSFQYRDLAQRKYEYDAGWLKQNKGFTIDEACAAVRAIARFANEHLMATLQGLRDLPKEQCTLRHALLLDDGGQRL